MASWSHGLPCDVSRTTCMVLHCVWQARWGQYDNTTSNTIPQHTVKNRRQHPAAHWLTKPSQ